VEDKTVGNADESLTDNEAGAEAESHAQAVVIGVAAHLGERKARSLPPVEHAKLGRFALARRRVSGNSVGT